MMLDRRSFIKISLLGVANASLPSRRAGRLEAPFPETGNLGRAVAEGLKLHARPDSDSPLVRRLALDEIVSIHRTLAGVNPYRINQNWVETPDGFAWAPEIQPVGNFPNQAATSLPGTSLGEGAWAEVTVPYVDLEMDNPPARAPWLENRIEAGYPPRFFYSQIAWVDQIRTGSNGQVQYRLNERYGYGDRFWAAAAGLRLLAEEELTPIHPDSQEKRVLVDVTRQTLSCFEGGREVYFCRVSTGAFLNFRGERVDSWGTPRGRHRIWRKAVSLPLSGGSAALGWDLPAVGWISLFVGSGVALHSTYWHNDFGVPTSRGCVNLKPEDARWLFRWTEPGVPPDPGDVTIGMPGGTMIEVIET